MRRHGFIKPFRGLPLLVLAIGTLSASCEDDGGKTILPIPTGPVVHAAGMDTAHEKIEGISKAAWWKLDADIACDTRPGEGGGAHAVIYSPGLLARYDEMHLLSPFHGWLHASIDNGLWPGLLRDYAELLNVPPDWRKIELKDGETTVVIHPVECKGIPRQETPQNSGSPVKKHEGSFATRAGPGCVRVYVGRGMSDLVVLRGGTLSGLKVGGRIDGEFDTQVFFFHPPEIPAGEAVVTDRKTGLELELDLTSPPR